MSLEGWIFFDGGWSSRGSQHFCHQPGHPDIHSITQLLVGGLVRDSSGVKNLAGYSLKLCRFLWGEFSVLFHF